MRWIVGSLVSTVVVGGLLVACSSTSSSGTTPPVDASAKDTGVTAAKDSGPKPVAEGGSSSSGTCPVQGAASAIIPWVAPGPITLGACDAADITAFTTSWNDINQTFLQTYQAVKAPCQACFFTLQQTGVPDTKWNTVVLAPDIQSNPNDAFTNFGACYDLLYTGGGTGAAACGKGAQDDQFCLDAACPDQCTPDDTTAQNCYTAATNTGAECATYDGEETTGCGSADDALTNDCGDPTVSIQTLCGNGELAGDAGTVGDSGAD